MILGGRNLLGEALAIYVFRLQTQILPGCYDLTKRIRM